MYNKRKKHKKHPVKLLMMNYVHKLLRIEYRLLNQMINQLLSYIFK